MPMIHDGGEEFLGRLGGPPGTSPGSGPLAGRTTPLSHPRRSARGRVVLVRTVLRHAAQDGLQVARSPWFWLGGVLAVALPIILSGFLAREFLGAGDSSGEGMGGSAAIALRQWTVPLGLAAWALMACAGPLPRGSVWARYSQRILGRAVPCAVVSAACVVVLRAAAGEPASAAAAAAGAVALSSGLCGAVGASVRAAVVRPRPTWVVAATAALWLGGGNFAAFAAFLPATIGASPRQVAANVERDALGRLTGFECLDAPLADYTSIHPERIAWIIAPSPLVLQAEVSAGAAPRGSAAEFGPALLEMAAVGPAAVEPCLDGKGPESIRPLVPLGPIGVLQLGAAAGALALVGARRATWRAPGSAASRSGGGRAATP